MFVTQYNEIIEIIENINPIKYGKTRNYINGDVTKLSPYISRGIISTKQVAARVLAKGYKPYEIESLLKELAWRDYFQQVWIALKDDINKDIKQAQPQVSNHKISKNIINANTQVKAIDIAINNLMETGYMHNHNRMYVSSICCNIAKSHWLIPAKWMYYYLLDADWASNALSWQWVAGSFSSKKYYANQENINKYAYTNQSGTFLDVSYENFADIDIPNILNEYTDCYFETNLPTTNACVIDNNLPICVYNFYNLDCNWLKEIHANRVLLLEPSFFKQYPVCQKTIDFIIDLSKNINNIQIYVGEFAELFDELRLNNIHFKEHPTNSHYKGVEHKRDWMFEQVTGYYPSFFSYWKKCEKHLKSNL